MKNIVFLSIILLSIGCFSGSKKANKSEIKAPVKTLPSEYMVQTISQTSTPNQFFTGTVNTGIDYNNTRVRIFLDSLINGAAVDTTIVRNNTVTTYSFTPQINFWNKTDTCYSARYFITVDVRQEITPYVKEILEKKVAEMDTQIAEEEKRTAAKKQLRAKLKAQ